MKNNRPSSARVISQSRRHFLKGTVASSALLGLNLAGWGPSVSFASDAAGTEPVTLLDPSTQQKFINPLPLPKRIYAEANDSLILPIAEVQQWAGLKDADGNQLMTTLYGFQYEGGVTSPGPTIVARQNQEIFVEWQNQLPNNKPPLLPVDITLHVPHIVNFDEQNN